MKYPLIIVVLCIAFIGFVNVWKTDKVKTSTNYVPIQHPAPDNLLDYPPQNAEDHGDGLYSQVITPATNNLPLRAYDIVHLKYKLWNESGLNVDSSDRRFHLMKLRVDGGGKINSVIEGWQRILAYLKEGETRRVWIPEHLAYANSQNEATKGRLVFDITVDKVERPIPTPEFEDYPAEPPAESIKFPSGLIGYKTKSSQQDIVPPTDAIVEIHLNLWDNNGELIRSTEKVNRQTQISLNHTIAGMKEAVSSMKVGERYRFWMPASLAYGDTPPDSWPTGNAICDIELLTISEPLKDVTTHRMQTRNSK